MRWFPIHILIKDLSFMILYFVIMKYNLTSETYLPETIRYFPGAPDMTFVNMIGASLFYNIIPLLVSLVTYYFIVSLMRKLFKKVSSLSLITTGFVLTLTTPLLYFALSGWKHNDYYLIKAEVIAWVLCFVISIVSYYQFNKSTLQLTDLDA